MALLDHALVVGIDRYPGITNLSGPERDARDFHRWVTTIGGVDPANATLIVSSNFVPPAPDARSERPVAQQIQDCFTDFDIAAEANNKAELGLRTGRRLWMFFSGHGFAPTMRQSGVLMANSTLRRLFTIAATQWADTLWSGGWFDEVVLFQDTCRSRIAAANLEQPFLLVSEQTQKRSDLRKRFYAFSAKDGKISKEVPLPPNGDVRGVFTATLLDGLNGAARDPTTGAITARSLHNYLQDTMKSRLPPADLLNPDIANEPEVFANDMFDIVPAAQVAGPVLYHVDIALPAAVPTLTLRNSNLDVIPAPAPVGTLLSLQLPTGIYLITGDGLEMKFSVLGPGTGADGAIHVRA